MKRWSAPLILIFASLSALADNASVTLKGGMWSFSTKNISASSDSESGFGAYAIEMGYAFWPKWQAALGLNMLLSDGFGGQTGFGVDAGMKYYFLTDAGTSITRNEDVSVSVTEKFRPYAGFFLKQRTFNFILSTTFVGGGLNVGCDYSLGKDWFLNAEIRYDMLYGPDEGQATQTNILFGAGLEF